MHGPEFDAVGELAPPYLRNVELLVNISIISCHFLSQVAVIRDRIVLFRSEQLRIRAAVTGWRKRDAMKVTTVRAIAVIVFIACGGTQAMSYDALTDFSVTNNPNGTWSYGYGVPGSSFTAYPSSTNNCTGISGLNCWNVFTDSVPYVGENVTGSPIREGSLTIPTGVLDIHPYVSPYDTIVEWTAPSTGNWQITGFYELLDTSSQGTTAFIYAGATQLLDQALTTSNSSVDFTFTEALTTGETVEFAEGPNASGGYFSDSTGFDATVSPVPEPASCALLWTALAGFGASRRRKPARAQGVDM